MATQIEFTYAPQMHIFTVTELTRAIKAQLESDFAELWVEGEISNLRNPSSGHCYCTLKDAGGQIRAVLFKNQRRLVHFDLEDGLEVIARGRLSVYEARGEYQIIIDHLEPKGIGALQLAFEQLKQRLFAEGLFDAEHKQPLPMLPRRIGVITSSSGAAIRDILKVLERRFANLQVVLFAARVQGDEAPAELIAGIDAFNRLSDVDVIIIGRGGGSIEDLWAFNDEALARAIFASAIPIISAVGHEIDFTISDFVADVRAPTPSAAAEMVVCDKQHLQLHLAALVKQLAGGLQRRVVEARIELTNLLDSRTMADPAARLREYQQRLDELSADAEAALRRSVSRRRELVAHQARNLALVSPLLTLPRYRSQLHRSTRALATAARHRLARSRARLHAVAGRLEALSPLAVLGRGYSICRREPQGAVVRDAASVQVGEQVNVLLHRGALGCRVEERIPSSS